MTRRRPAGESAARCFAFRSEEEPLAKLPDCDHRARHGDWGEAFDCARGEPDAICLLAEWHPGAHDWTSIEHVSLVPGPNWGGNR